MKAKTETPLTDEPERNKEEVREKMIKSLKGLEFYKLMLKNMCSPDAVISLAFIAKEKDGGGRVGAAIEETESFIEDLLFILESK